MVVYDLAQDYCICRLKMDEGRQVGRPCYVLCFVKFLPEMRFFMEVKKQSYLQLYKKKMVATLNVFC